MSNFKERMEDWYDDLDTDPDKKKVLVIIGIILSVAIVALLVVLGFVLKGQTPSVEVKAAQLISGDEYGDERNEAGGLIADIDWDNIIGYDRDGNPIYGTNGLNASVGGYDMCGAPIQKDAMTVIGTAEDGLPIYDYSALDEARIRGIRDGKNPDIDWNTIVGYDKDGNPIFGTNGADPNILGYDMMGNAIYKGSVRVSGRTDSGLPIYDYSTIQTIRQKGKQQQEDLRSGKRGSSITVKAGYDGVTPVSYDGSDGDDGSDGSSKKGSSGKNGMKSPDGNSGADGRNGSDGTDGTSGKNGTGRNGKSGSDGTSGIAGKSGKSGRSGLRGDKGPDGTSGNDGKDGTSGINGNNGKSGSSGTNGINGSDGQKGVSGNAGKSGSDGSDGTSGLRGSDGYNGMQGSDGYDGIQGRKGNDGKNGQNNYTKGKDGKKGATGNAGKDGTDGTSGTDGNNAENGKKGASGTESFLHVRYAIGGNPSNKRAGEVHLYTEAEMRTITAQNNTSGDYSVSDPQYEWWIGSYSDSVQSDSACSSNPSDYVWQRLTDMSIHPTTENDVDKLIVSDD